MVLDDMVRFKMAKDIALGMVYLHQRRPPIIHKDLKSLVSFSIYLSLSLSLFLCVTIFCFIVILLVSVKRKKKKKSAQQLIYDVGCVCECWPVMWRRTFLWTSRTS